MSKTEKTIGIICFALSGLSLMINNVSAEPIVLALIGGFVYLSNKL